MTLLRVTTHYRENYYQFESSTNFGDYRWHSFTLQKNLMRANKRLIFEDFRKTNQLQGIKPKQINKSP